MCYEDKILKNLTLDNVKFNHYLEIKCYLKLNDSNIFFAQLGYLFGTKFEPF